MALFVTCDRSGDRRSLVLSSPDCGVARRAPAPQSVDAAAGSSGLPHDPRLRVSSPARFMSWSGWRGSNPLHRPWQGRALPLSYIRIWWSLSGSNRRPPACKAGALPSELRPRSEAQIRRRRRSAQFLFRVNLAAADLAAGLLVMPPAFPLAPRPVP